MSDYERTVMRLIHTLEKEEDFEELVALPAHSSWSTESKYSKLRNYLENRMGSNPLEEIPRSIIQEIPRIYRVLLKYGEVIHPVPRCESRRVSALPAMTAEVLIHFVDFSIH